MEAGTAAGGGSDHHPDIAVVETALTVLLQAYDKAIDELANTVPSAQIRALLIIARSGSLNLRGLAAELGASASSASMLCDRMQAAGLLTREQAADGGREIVLRATESGRRLADWIRERRRAALSAALSSMPPRARDALAYGLGELAAGSGDRLAAWPQRPEASEP